jgi:hypothetical protein
MSTRSGSLPRRIAKRVYLPISPGLEDQDFKRHAEAEEALESPELDRWDSPTRRHDQSPGGPDRAPATPAPDRDQGSCRHLLHLQQGQPDAGSSLMAGDPHNRERLHQRHLATHNVDRLGGDAREPEGVGHAQPHDVRTQRCERRRELRSSWLE